MNELARQQQHYAEVKQRLYGKPQLINVNWLEKLNREREQLAEQRRRERIEQVREQREAQVELLRLKIGIANFELRGVATANNRQVIGVAPTPLSPVEYEPRLTTFMEIAQTVLMKYRGVTIDHIRSDCRKRRVVMIRREIIHAIRALRPTASLPAIGRFLHKDHTSILNALRRPVRMP